MASQERANWIRRLVQEAAGIISLYAWILAEDLGSRLDGGVGVPLYIVYEVIHELKETELPYTLLSSWQFGYRWATNVEAEEIDQNTESRLRHIATELTSLVAQQIIPSSGSRSDHDQTILVNSFKSIQANVEIALSVL